MSKVDKQALRELAEKATTGPWITHTDKWGELSVRSNNAEDAAEYAECGVFYEIAERIGGHVRGDDFDDFSEVHANAQLIAAANPAAVLALLDEIESLRKDKDRLDRLDRLCESYGFQDIHEGNRWQIDGPYRCVRDAIDDAIQMEKDRG